MLWKKKMLAYFWYKEGICWLIFYMILFLFVHYRPVALNEHFFHVLIKISCRALNEENVFLPPSWGLKEINFQMLQSPPSMWWYQFSVIFSLTKRCCPSPSKVLDNVSWMDSHMHAMDFHKLIFLHFEWIEN